MGYNWWRFLLVERNAAHNTLMSSSSNVISFYCTNKFSKQLWKAPQECNSNHDDDKQRLVASFIFISIFPNCLYSVCSLAFYSSRNVDREKKRERPTNGTQYVWGIDYWNQQCKKSWFVFGALLIRGIQKLRKYRRVLWAAKNEEAEEKANKFSLSRL